MKRVTVIGVSGSGKTTLARTIAERLKARHLELDAFYHQPGWTQLPKDEFQRRIREIIDTQDRWVSCGNYNSFVGDILQARADTIVWLDLPRVLTTQRVAKRTFRRALSREPLWNGNREPLSNFYRWDPEKNIIRWSWVHYDKYRRQYLERMINGTWDHARVVRLCHPAEVDRFLTSVPFDGQPSIEDQGS